MKEKLSSILLNFLLICGVLVTLIPYLYMVSASFKPQSEIFQIPIKFWPKNFTFENISMLFSAFPFVKWFFNSIIVAVLTTVIALFLCSLAGFALAKYNFKGKKIMFALILSTMMIPFPMLIVPLFEEMVAFNWINTFQGLVVPATVSGFGIFLMRQYMMSIPTELLDSARIDGCTEFGIYWRVILPLARSALGLLAILFFTGSWNDFLWPLIIVNQDSMFTIPLGIATMSGPYEIEYGTIMAGSFIGSLPIIIVFLLMQKQFIEGLTAGAIKS